VLMLVMLQPDLFCYIYISESVSYLSFFFAAVMCLFSILVLAFVLCVNKNNNNNSINVWKVCNANN